MLIKSCSIESRNDPSPKSEVVHETKFSSKISYSTHVCLAQLDRHQNCKPMMVGVVSSNPTGGNFIFLRHLDANFIQKWQKCQICVFPKTSNANWPHRVLFHRATQTHSSIDTVNPEEIQAFLTAHDLISTCSLPPFVTTAMPPGGKIRI